jgi:hypothetical protein
MTIDGQRLLNLLPALYRLRDAEVAASQGISGTPANPAVGPLEALLTLVAEQLAIFSDDLDQLYDDQFIETCADWVIPYIGDLIGYQTVNGVAPAVASPRAEVAHTISFRRRKGTVLVLEQLARDVTGWGAHAVEFFQLLSGTQYMKHIRATSGGTPDLRDWHIPEYLNTGFDQTAHTIDVRNIASGRGRSNIQNIGIFLWSLNAYNQPLTPAPPVSGAAQCFRFSPLGADMPLFTHAVSQGSQVNSAAQPINVPDRLHRRILCQDLQTGTGAAYYGPANSLALSINGTPLQPYQVKVANLSGVDGHWLNLPLANSAYAAAIDPELGRIALPPLAAGAAAPTVQAAYYYGFNADMAGGPYSRVASFTASAKLPILRVPGKYPTIHAALAALTGQGVVEITDSNTYSEPAGLTIPVNANQHIELRAADGQKPTLVLGAPITVTGGALGKVDINGLLITCPPPAAGTTVPPALVHVPTGTQLTHLGFTHCTLVPGWSLTSNAVPATPAQPALVVEQSGTAVVISKTITGSIRLNPLATISLADSFLDATIPTGVAYAALDGASAGGALTLTACTVIGKVHATLLSLVSDTIFESALAASDTWPAALWADRRQQGCVRFSYLPATSIVPQPYESIFQATGTPEPCFYTLRYGQPEYGKLLTSTDDTIRRGANDGGEMGAFHFVLAPLREADLRVRLAEYLAVGMECGLLYAT